MQQGHIRLQLECLLVLIQGLLWQARLGVSGSQVHLSLRVVRIQADSLGKVAQRLVVLALVISPNSPIKSLDGCFRRLVSKRSRRNTAAGEAHGIGPARRILTAGAGRHIQIERVPGVRGVNLPGVRDPWSWLLEPSSLKSPSHQAESNGCEQDPAELIRFHELRASAGLSVIDRKDSPTKPIDP